MQHHFLVLNGKHSGENSRMYHLYLRTFPINTFCPSPTFEKSTQFQMKYFHLKLKAVTHPEINQFQCSGGEEEKVITKGKKSLCRMLPSAVFGNYQSRFLLKCWYICWTTWHWHIGDKIIHLSPLICTSWDKLATEERNSQVIHNLEGNIKL